MGRYVGSAIRSLAADSRITLTLLVRDPRAFGRDREIAGGLDIAALSAAREPGRFGAVWYPWNGIRFAAAAPSLVTINDDFAFAYPARGRIARWREQRPILRAIERATTLVTISNWVRDRLIDRFALDAQRIGIIPLGPEPFFTPGDEASPYSEPFVLAVGTQEERKNIGFLIDAVGQAFPAGDIRLVLVGGIDERLRQRARAANVLLTECGHIDDLALRRLYRTAAAVAVPSLAEGFGLVAAEAQACGAAVIAANTGALPEAVETAGILADPANRPLWASALRDLVRSEPLNAYYRARGLERWRPDSGARTADALRSMFERLIDERA